MIDRHHNTHCIIGAGPGIKTANGKRAGFFPSLFLSQRKGRREQPAFYISRREQRNPYRLGSRESVATEEICMLSLKTGCLSLLSALLAASAQNRCTSLVCSCYVPSRCSDCKDDLVHQNHHRSSSSNSSSNNKKRFSVANKDGVRQDLCNDRLQSQGNRRINGTHIDPIPLKSNLKKFTAVEKDQERVATRKVNWPDAHGKDIANVQVFEPR